MLDEVDLQTAGYAIVADVLTPDEVGSLREQLAKMDGVGARRRESVYAVRGLLRHPAVQKLAASEAVRALVAALLGPDAVPVKATLFDKTPDANWLVPWHQDTMIAVRERREVPGFGPWSVKAGVPHVQPPADVLAGMLAVRLHLDDCPAENGALRVLPGSHQQGLLSQTQIDAWKEQGAVTPCPVPGGGALVMRPLLLHASSASDTPGHRRVIHVEYAAGGLPGGLEWDNAT